MALTRLYEEHEVTPQLRRLYSDVRSSFDLPFVPSLFKAAAYVPDYLKSMWHDLGPVARSREFHSAGMALEEFTRSLAVSDGWHYSDQERVLAEQKFSGEDIEQFAAIVGIFVRLLPRMVLFARLAQRGYSGGQAGRISSGKHVSAVSRLVTLHVPNERDAGLRTWLIYNDIRKTTGGGHVLSMLRVLSPFPGYLNSVWVETKKIMREDSFLAARERVNKRALSLLNGLPVRDHRLLAKGVTPGQWKDIEETVDGYVKLLPAFSLIAPAWQRSFPKVRSALFAA
ncbi:MAG: halocarboxylic acid dehydrogenase DehI family protein [Terriglobales bacterium]